MKPKQIFITGATDGIGQETARQLLTLGHSVVIHGRSAEKIAKTRTYLAERTGVASETIHSVQADLSDLQAVQSMGKQLASQFPDLQVLILNAGIFATAPELSQQGFELSWAVNHLANFVLVDWLLGSLRQQQSARIITLSSIAHTRGQIDFGNLRLEKPFNGYRVYAQSKLANVLFANTLARQLAGSNITSNSVHPGVITTKLLRSGFGATGDSVAEGARTSVYLADSAEVAGVSGKYFVNCMTHPTAPLANDLALQDLLWTASHTATRPFLTS
ncbi:MAG TPA: SDR family NAD(P)-dependent oxidoreductase [Anaerolineales bacterium]|nr:SDR family NAD(P)-dependent oxidoreductase [Anaerolineales bacterium]